MISRLSFLAILLCALGSSFAQCTISFDTFSKRDNITTNSIAWSDEYSKPISDGKKMSFIQRYTGGELSYNLVSVDFKNQHTSKYPLNLPQEIDVRKIEKFKSSCSFIQLEHISLFVTFGHLYILEGPPSALRVKMEIDLGNKSGEENIHVKGDVIYLIDKVQPGFLKKGGLSIIGVDFVKGKIVKERFIEDFGSFFYFYDRSFNYSVFTGDCILLYDREKDEIWNLDYNLKKLKRNLHYPSQGSVEVDKKHLKGLLGQVALLDTIVSISNSTSRLVRFCSYNNSVIVLRENISTGESKNIVYDVLFTPDLINFTNIKISQEDYILLTQGVLCYNEDKLVLLHNFGNIDLSEGDMKEEDMMKQLMFGKPYKLGVYVFDISM